MIDRTQRTENVGIYERTNSFSIVNNDKTFSKMFSYFIRWNVNGSLVSFQGDACLFGMVFKRYNLTLITYMFG